MILSTSARTAGDLHSAFRLFLFLRRVHQISAPVFVRLGRVQLHESELLAIRFRTSRRLLWNDKDAVSHIETSASENTQSADSGTGTTTLCLGRKQLRLPMAANEEDPFSSDVHHTSPISKPSPAHAACRYA